MAKYHINAKGVPAICRAEKGNCPFGGEGEHYDSPEQAQAAADEQNKAEFGAIPLDGSGNSDGPDELILSRANPADDIALSITVDEDGADFLKDMDAVDPDGVMRKLKENFSEGSMVVEATDNPMDYSLSHKGEGIYNQHLENVAELKEEGYETLGLYNENLYNDKDPEFNPYFKEVYGDFLKERQGEPKEVMGRTLMEVPRPDSPEVKEFFKKYATERDFGNIHNVGIGFTNTIDQQGIDDIEATSAKRPDIIVENLHKNFEKGSLITEADRGPLSSSLYCNSEGVYDAYQNNWQELDDQGYDTSRIYDKEDQNYTPEFEEAYKKYVEENSGEPKEVMGQSLKTVPNPDSEEVKEFFKSFAKKK